MTRGPARQPAIDSSTAVARADKDKADLICDLAVVRAQILELARALPPSERTVTFLGSWNAADLLAHLAGWDWTNMQAAQDVLAGRLPAFFAYHDRGWASYNQALVERFGRVDFNRLILDVEGSHQELLRCLEAIPAEEFDRDRGLRSRGWKVTIGRLLQAELHDEIEHLEQLRAMAACQGRPIDNACAKRENGGVSG